MFTNLQFLVLACLCNFGTSQVRDEDSLDALYESGVDAFMEERWDECIANFERALDSFKKSKDGTVDCHRRCNEDVAASTPMMADNIENLQSSEKLVKKSICFLECGSDMTSYSFDKLKSYEYLQHCYFQKKQLQKAASAVYTVLAEDPGNKEMTSLLEFYATQPGFDVKTIVNHEAHPFLTNYRRGLAAYDRKDFVQVIQFMEQSLLEYLSFEEECRASCADEEPSLLNWVPESRSPVVNHVASDLECKRACPLTLTTHNGERQEDLPSDHFKYLHFAYFKVGDIRKACEALSSFSLFQANDVKTSSILTHYKSLSANSGDLCVPREAAVNYVTRQNYENQLFKVISKWTRQQERGVLNRDSNIMEKQAWPGNGKVSTKDHDIHRRSLSVGGDLKALDDSAEINAIREAFLKKTRLLKTDAELKGPNRVMAEGLASEQECKTLMKMAKTAAMHGNGYIRNNTATPWSDREELQTVSKKRAALMGHFGIVEQSAVDLLFEVSERAKAYLEHHFNLKGKLFFEHSNLLCRNPFKGDEKNQLPDSHPPHADNCALQKNGSCIRGDWTYWRDYTANIYLNDVNVDFTGGEFFFTKNNSESGITATVLPRCGQLLGFSSGPENLHGVRAVRTGSRCSLVQLFTLTPSRQDTNRVLAQTVRDRSRLMGPIRDTVVENLDDYKEFS